MSNFLILNFELDLSLEICHLSLIMCLSIPKKITSIKNNDIVVESFDGEKQRVKSIIDVKIGDNVLTQNNIIIQKISKKQAKEIDSLFNSKK
jgi:hydrogenase maturation factor